MHRPARLVWEGAGALSARLVTLANRRLAEVVRVSCPGRSRQTVRSAVGEFADGEWISHSPVAPRRRSRRRDSKAVSVQVLRRDQQRVGQLVKHARSSTVSSPLMRSCACLPSLPRTSRSDAQRSASGAERHSRMRGQGVERASTVFPGLAEGRRF